MRQLSGSLFPVGTTTVTCTATDAAGNDGTASLTVTVVDTTAPAITVPPNIKAPATGPTGAVVTYAVTASDVVDGDVPPTCSPASGSLFPVGTTTVTCDAVDAAGNSTAGVSVSDESGSYTFLVTVTPYEGPVASTPPTTTAVDQPGPIGTGLLPLVALSIVGAAGLLALLLVEGWRRRDTAA